MVTVTAYEKRQNQEGEDFYVLLLQGEAEIIRSKETGNHYATAKQCTISASFGEEGCKKLVGKTLPGRIEKAECEPYDFEVPGTEQTIRLDYTYRYAPEDTSVEEEIGSAEAIR